MNNNDVMSSLGVNGLFSMILVIGSILVVWYLLQELKLDSWFKQPRSPKARVLIALLAVTIGYLFARFILDYMTWASALKFL